MAKRKKIGRGTKETAPTPEIAVAPVPCTDDEAAEILAAFATILEAVDTDDGRSLAALHAWFGARPDCVIGTAGVEVNYLDAPVAVVAARRAVGHVLAAHAAWLEMLTAIQIRGGAR